MLAARLVTAAALVAALATGSQARADIATEWNTLAVEATAVPANSILQSRVLAIMHVGHVRCSARVKPETGVACGQCGTGWAKLTRGGGGDRCLCCSQTPRAGASGCDRRRLQLGVVDHCGSPAKGQRGQSLGRAWPKGCWSCAPQTDPRKRWTSKLSNGPAPIS